MQYLNLRESAQIIGCHPETLRRKLRKGKLAAVYQNQFGWYFLRSDDVLQLREKQRKIKEMQRGNPDGGGEKGLSHGAR